MDAVAVCLWPEMKMQVRAFLGMAGYYRRFIPAFAALTSPLTDLTQKKTQIRSSGPSNVSWRLRR